MQSLSSPKTLLRQRLVHRRATKKDVLVHAGGRRAVHVRTTGRVLEEGNVEVTTFVSLGQPLSQRCHRLHVGKNRKTKKEKGAEGVPGNSNCEGPSG